MTQIAAPPGWITRAERPTTVFVPPDVPNTESYTIALFQPQSAGTASPAQWISARADADVKVLLAAVERSGEVRNNFPGVMSTTRIMRASRGLRLIGIYFGVTRIDAASCAGRHACRFRHRDE